jgi:hypothetical protein
MYTMHRHRLYRHFLNFHVFIKLPSTLYFFKTFPLAPISGELEGLNLKLSGKALI